ncbi:MAG: phage major capsid protein [Bacilli bacterium]
MTQLLKTYLKIGLEEPNGRALEHAVASIPRSLGTVHDGKVEPVRELLLTTAIESTTLIQTEMHATVLEGAEPWKCMRQACRVLPMKANTLTIPVGDVGSYAPEVAEGAEIPISDQDYTSVTLTAKKYGVRPMVTDEMVADSLYPVIEMEIQKAGAKLENTLNKIALGALIDGTANNEPDTNGANQGIKAIATAVKKVKSDHFLADRIVMCPDAEALIMADYIPTGYVGAEAAQNGKLPNLLGLAPFVTSVEAASTQTWGYAADGNIGMVVFDSNNSTVIGERQGITVKRYEDIIRQIQGGTVSARWAVGTLQANAGARIEF